MVTNKTGANTELLVLSAVHRVIFDDLVNTEATSKQRRFEEKAELEKKLNLYHILKYPLGDGSN